MPPLARPARALPVRRTIGGKRAEIGAAEDELRRVRQIERTPGDERTTVDHRHGHAVRAVGERHQRPAGQRAVRDAEDRLRIGLPAGGPVAVEAGPIPAGDHDPAGRRWLERRKHDRLRGCGLHRGPGRRRERRFRGRLRGWSRCRPGLDPCDRFWLREVLDRARAAGDPLEAFDLECGRDGHRARRSFMARPDERDGQRERERGDASAHQWFPDHGSRPRAGPIPPCVDFVNTEEARRHCVRGERSLPWSSFSRYEVVTRRKAAALATR